MPDSVLNNDQLMLDYAVIEELYMMNVENIDETNNGNAGFRRYHEADIKDEDVYIGREEMEEGSSDVSVSTVVPRIPKLPPPSPHRLERISPNRHRLPPPYQACTQSQVHPQHTTAQTNKGLKCQPYRGMPPHVMIPTTNT